MSGRVLRVVIAAAKGPGYSNIELMILWKTLAIGSEVRMMVKRKGFTLIELLVVIAIIALLMSVLMPALASVRKQTRSIVCQSNLRQWALVWKQFADDHGGFFPPDLGHGRYAALSRPALKEYYMDNKLLLCPAATEPYAPEGDGRNPFAAWRSPASGDPLGSPLVSYGINSWVLKEAYTGGQIDALMWRSVYINKAHEVPMVLDCGAYQNATPWHHDEPPLSDGYIEFGTNDNEMRYVCLNRHNEAINGTFLDFHVRRIGLKELWELRWHRCWYNGASCDNPPDYNPPDWKPHGDYDGWMEHMKDYSRVKPGS